MGTVTALYRYPVKSMLGEAVIAAAVTENGLRGPRVRRARPLVPAPSVEPAVVGSQAPAPSSSDMKPPLPDHASRATDRWAYGRLRE
ncbi:hypothetical protein [Streptomyces sp. N50]|uniref:hypothetical protein n=1 Tax=Streptomyces sp. N50 TaxID=3081765 RepID=UPI002961ECE8|nr:hypothetical protein [Streptomyces sp. N50]WOX15164.1 hypothetical protein R2B38_42755 [Streptomyces sp. N50]